MSSTNMWFTADVARVLAAVRQAQNSVLAYVPPSPTADAYRAGCTETLAAIAAGFGLPATPVQSISTVMSNGGYN